MRKALCHKSRKNANFFVQLLLHESMLQRLNHKCFSGVCYIFYCTPLLKLATFLPNLVKDYKQRWLGSMFEHKKYLGQKNK
jgi:hypothetical protein